MNQHSRRLGWIWLGLVTTAASVAGCGEAIVHTRGDAGSLIAKVTAVVSLPPKLGFGRAAEQRRANRRTGDALIQLTGGHAILAEELAGGGDPELIADSVRALGEDPAHTLTFAVTGARTERAEAVAVPSSGGRARMVRRYSDYTVRLDVRRADGPDVLGSIETYTTVFTNGPEIDAEGRPLGLQQAIESATRAALKSFAPNLVPTAPFPRLAEVPARNEETMQGGALAAVDKLRRLQTLYPELSPDDLATLASSNARFLIVEPGRLAALGVTAGDLVSGMGGQTLGSRAALARILARGDTPAMSVDRVSGRFLVGQTLVARSR
jgi:hypothetical protein